MADTDGDLIPDDREQFSMLRGKDPQPPPPIEDPDDPPDVDPDAPDFPDLPKPGWSVSLGGIPVPMILMILIPLLLAIVIAIILLRQKPPEDEILDIIERTRRKLQKTKDMDKVREIIIECYRAMCLVFAKYGLARLDSETVNEFRVAMETLLPIKKKPIDELTALFEVARYSDHKLKNKTRKQAIRALDGVRNEIIRVKRSGKMKAFRSDRKEKIKKRGQMVEKDLSLRRKEKFGMVVFHQDMTQEAQQAYFLKELQSSYEKSLDTTEVEEFIDEEEGTAEAIVLEEYDFEALEAEDIEDDEDDAVTPEDIEKMQSQRPGGGTW